MKIMKSATTCHTTINRHKTTIQRIENYENATKCHTTNNRHKTTIERKL